MFSTRVANRGLEGIACAPGGKVYAALQRPLDNPVDGKKTSEASRMVRVLEQLGAAGSGQDHARVYL